MVGSSSCDASWRPSRLGGRHRVGAGRPRGNQQSVLQPAAQLVRRLPDLPLPAPGRPVRAATWLVDDDRISRAPHWRLSVRLCGSCLGHSHAGGRFPAACRDDGSRHGVVRLSDRKSCLGACHRAHRRRGDHAVRTGRVLRADEQPGHPRPLLDGPDAGVGGAVRGRRSDGSSCDRDRRACRARRRHKRIRRSRPARRPCWRSSRFTSASRASIACSVSRRGRCPGS